MGRVFFPTVSLNRFGVRDTSATATLGGAGGEHFPADPTPRAAMTPTGPMLGGLGLVPRFIDNGNGGGWGPRPPLVWAHEGPPTLPYSPGAGPAPYVAPPAVPPTRVVSSSGGGGGIAPAPASPAVAAQNSPTPTATLPTPAAPGAILISSGGGTQTPATAAPAAAPASTGIVDGITAWLSGTTSLLNYNVPNALLAGAVVLGFAWLSSGSTGRKR